MVLPAVDGKRKFSVTGWPSGVPGVMFTIISLPRMLGAACCAVESLRMRSVAGTPSIFVSMVRNTSIFCGFGAVPTSDGLSKRMRSTLPIFTPASFTSEPSRKPFASAKRARRCKWLLKGFNPPDAFRTRRIRTASAIKTSKPTRSSLIPMFMVDFGMAPPAIFRFVICD